MRSSAPRLPATWATTRSATALARFVGDIEQVPTAVSAIKVDGRRAYERVRAGEEVVLAARPVTVHELVVHEVRAAADCVDVDFSVRCSSGTYVRAIARDLGAALGVGGHLTALRRTAVGAFDLSAACTLDDLAERGAGAARGHQRTPPGPPSRRTTSTTRRPPTSGSGRRLAIDLPADGPGGGVRARRGVPRPLRATWSPGGRRGGRVRLTFDWSSRPERVLGKYLGRGQGVGHTPPPPQGRRIQHNGENTCQHPSSVLP